MGRVFELGRVCITVWWPVTQRRKVRMKRGTELSHGTGGKGEINEDSRANEKDRVVSGGRGR